MFGCNFLKMWYGALKEIRFTNYFMGCARSVNQYTDLKIDECRYAIFLLLQKS